MVARGSFLLVHAALAAATAGASAAPQRWHLLVLSDRDGDPDVYAVEPTTGRITAVTRNRADDRWLQLSGDGRFLLVERAAGVYLVRTDGRGERPMNDLPVAFSPDSRSVASTRWLPGWRSRIVLTPVGGGGARDLGSGRPVAFAPGGRLLAFLGDDDSLRILDLRTGRRDTVATRDALEDTVPLRSRADAPDYWSQEYWSPSARYVAWVKDAPEAETDQLVVADVTSAAPPQVVLQAPYVSAEWLPGDRLGVTTPSGPTYAHRILAVDGTRLTPAARGGDACTWSPDGKRLACTGKHLDVVTVATGARRSFPFAASHLTWSPDARRLAARVGKDAAVVDVVAGTATTVGHTVWLGYPTWSPDGRRLAYAGADGLYAATERAGSARRVVALTSVGTVRWAPGPAPPGSAS